MRKPKTVFVSLDGGSCEYEILQACKFNSTRKRMSSVVRGPDRRMRLFCKGAEMGTLERLAKDRPYDERTLPRLQVHLPPSPCLFC